MMVWRGSADSPSVSACGCRWPLHSPRLPPVRVSSTSATIAIWRFQFWRRFPCRCLVCSSQELENVQDIRSSMLRLFISRSCVFHRDHQTLIFLVCCNPEKTTRPSFQRFLAKTQTAMRKETSEEGFLLEHVTTDDAIVLAQSDYNFQNI
jgi:hypothetical protein